MDNNDIFLELLSLAKKHLELAGDENWDEWERVLAQKEELLNKLRHQKITIADEKGFLISEIEKYENLTKEILKEKKEKIRQELLRINKGSEAINEYKKRVRKESGGHFNIKC